MGRNQYSYLPEYRARMVELVQAGRTPEELWRGSLHHHRVS